MILDIIRYILSGLLVVVGVLMLRYITDILVYYFGADIVVLLSVLVLWYVLCGYVLRLIMNKLKKDMDNLNANVNLETKRGFGYDAINAGISYTNGVLGSDDEGDTIKAFEYGAHWCREQMLACLNAPLDGIQCKECGEAFLLKVLGCRLETLRKMLEVG